MRMPIVCCRERRISRSIGFPSWIVLFRLFNFMRASGHSLISVVVGVVFQRRFQSGRASCSSESESEKQSIESSRAHSEDLALGAYGGVRVWPRPADDSRLLLLPVGRNFHFAVDSCLCNGRAAQRAFGKRPHHEACRACRRAMQ